MSQERLEGFLGLSKVGRSRPILRGTRPENSTNHRGERRLGFFEKAGESNPLSEDEKADQIQQIKDVLASLSNPKTSLTRKGIEKRVDFGITYTTWAALEVDLLLDPRVRQIAGDNFMRYGWREPRKKPKT